MKHSPPSSSRVIGSALALGLAVVTSLPLNAQDCVPAPPGLKAWWPGEGVAGSLFDTTAPASSGITYVPGRVGLAMRLGSNGAGASVATPAVLDVQDFAVHAWIRRDAADRVSSDNGAVGWILARGAGGFGFGLGADGRLVLQRLGGGASVASTSAITDTAFHHVAVVRSGARVTFLVDGVEAGVSDFVDFLGYGGPGAVGRRADDGSGSFLGDLDELLFVDRPVSTAHVAAVHAAGELGLCALPVDVANDIAAGTERLIRGSAANGNVNQSSDGFSNFGTLRLESANGGYLSALTLTSGAVTNQSGGLVTIRRGSDGPRGLHGSLWNAGTVDVTWPLSVNVPGGTWENRGVLSIPSPGSLSLAGDGFRLELAEGSVTGGGSIYGEGIQVRFRGGSLSGVPFLVNSRLEIEPGNTNAGTFVMTGSGSVVSGAIQAGHGVVIAGSSTAGHTTARAPLGLATAGEVRLESRNGGYHTGLEVTGGPLKVLSGGRFRSARGTDGGRSLAAQVENDGVVDIDWHTTITAQGGTHVNRGAIGIAPGIGLGFNGAGQTFRQASGAIHAQGGFDMSGMTFRYESGEVTGSVYLDGTDLVLDPAGTDPVSLMLTRNGARVRGRLNANQSLWIRGDTRGGHTTALFPEGFRNAGSLRLESVGGGYTTSIQVEGGPFENLAEGTLLVRRGAEGSRVLGTELVNDGLVSFQWHTSLGKPDAVHVNRGTLSIQPGIGLGLAGQNQRFRQASGLLDIQGGLDISAMPFDYLGGEIRGVPYLDNVRLRLGPGTGPAEFNLTRNGSRIEGPVRQGQLLHVRGDTRGGHTTLVSSPGLENEGTIRLESFGGGYTSGLTVTEGPLRNRPSGLLHVMRLAEGPRPITAELFNEGTVRFSWHSSISTPGAVHVNRGQILVEAGIGLSLSGQGQTLRQEAGTFDVKGSLDLSAIRFEYLGGDLLGTPYLDGVSLFVGPDATRPTSFMMVRSTSEYRGAQHPGQQLWVRGDTRGGHMTLDLPEGLEIGGRVRLESVGGGYTAGLDAGTNTIRVLPTGTLDVLRNAEGPRPITGALVNEGNLNVRWHASLLGDGLTFRNRGAVDIDPGIGLNLSGTGQRFIQEAGPLDVQGGLNIYANTFRYAGGLFTGSAYLRHGRLELPASAGAGGSFLLRGITTVTGAVPARALVTFEGSQDAGHATMNLPDGLVNNGLMRIVANGGGYSTVISSPTRPFVNGPSGVIEILRNAEGTRRIDAEFVNRGRLDVRWHSRIGRAPAGAVSEGRIDVATGMGLTVDGPLQLTRGVLAGGGSVGADVVSEALVAPGPGFERLQINGAYRQGARGVLEIELSATEADQLSVSGPVSLGGVVRVVLAPGYVPEVGRVAQIVRGPLDTARPRLELPVLPDGRAWRVEYSTGLTVRVVAEPTPAEGVAIRGMVTGPDGQPVADAPVLVTGGVPAGVLAQYWIGTTGTGEPAITRAEPGVNNRWGNGGPGAPVGNDNFFSRWTGELVPAFSETYRLYTISDDGVRLWIGDTLLINNWTVHGDTENSATVELVAGRRYPIRMEHFENGGGATAVLEWSSPSVPRQVIPSTALVPPAGAPPALLEQLGVVTGPDGRYEVPVPAGLWTVDLPGLDARGFDPVEPVVVGTSNAPVTVDFRLAPASAPRLADLVPSVPVADATGVAGQPLAVQWSTANNGSGVARAPWRESVLLGRQPSGFDAVEVGHVVVGADQAAGTVVARDAVVEIPRGLSGNWYLFVRADTGLAVDESDGEVNNLGEGRPIQLLIGDLVVDQVLAPGSLRWGDTVDISWVVRNAGGSPVAAPWGDTVSFSPVPSGGTLLAEVAPARTTPLAPGETYTNTARVTVPLNSQNAPGTYYFLVRTDRGGAQPEASDSNNLGVSAGVAFERPAPPDLVVTSVQVADVVPAGRPVEVRWTVRNTGSTRAVGPWREVIALAPSADSAERTALVSIEIPEPLEPGAEVTRTRTILFPANLAGTHFLAIEADAGDRVFESGPASNNTGFSPASFRIAAPDLVATSVTGAAGRFGEPIPVRWVVRNGGNASAEGDWSDRLVLVGAGGERVVAQRARPGSEAIAAGTTYTQSLDLVIPLTAGAVAGEYTLRLDSDFRTELLESVETNNSVVSVPIRLDLPPMADLRVASVTAALSALPGESTTVTAQLSNAGVAPVPAGIVVRFELLPAVGAPIPLAAVRTEGALAPGATEPFPVPVTVPASVAGLVRFRVTADAAGDVVESDEANNAGESAAPTEVPRRITLRLPAETVAENAVPATVRARVSRSGPLDAALALALSSSDATEATVPATVEIPAGSAFAEFDVTVVADGQVDGTQVVQLTASAEGFNPGLAVLSVTDVDRAVLVLVSETNRVVEGLTVPVRVRRSVAATEALEIALGAGSVDLVPPATVILPAGATEVAFAVLAADNDRLEAVRRVGLTATAAGHSPAATELEILDNDDPGLVLQISPEQVGEGDGPLAATATLRRSRGIDRVQRVSVVADDPGRLVVPPEVVFGAGRDRVQFAVGPVNNRLNDGPKAVRVTASIREGSAGPVLATSPAALVTVQDDDSAALRIVLGTGVAREGRSPAFTAVVTRNSDTAAALTVQLTGSDATEATVPSSVVIPAGQGSVTFPVTTLDDGVVDGNQRVTFTASAEGHAPGTAVLTVSDSDLPDLAVGSFTIPETGTTGGDAAFAYRVVNQGLAAATGPFVQRVYLSADPFLSSDDTLVDETPFNGGLAVGGFFERQLTRRLPTVAGSFHAILVLDATGAVGEVLEENNRAVASAPIRIEPAYTAVVSTELTAAPSGTPVVLKGRAQRPGGAAAASEPVKVFVRVSGTERSQLAITDLEGRFETVFQPVAGEFGRYEVSAGHPGAASPATQDQFELLGLRADPMLQFTRIVPGRTNELEVTLTNPNERPLTGLRFEGSAVNALALAIEGPTRLEAGEAATVRVRVWSLEERDAAGRFVVRVTSAEGARLDFAADYSVEPPVARLVARPARLDAGMVRGRQTTVEIEIVNQGGADSGPLDITLPDLPWMRPATPPPLASLPPGGTVKVALLLTPSDTVALGLHDGRLAVGNDQARVTVPFSIRHVSDALGDLHVTAHDENTYYGNRQNVAGASVVLRDVFDNRALRTAVTDTNGVVTLAGVAEGTYNLEVSAPRHDTYVKTVRIAPGVVNREIAFLRTQLVRYNWKVEEVEFEERATVKLETIFETVVPVPVVTIEPSVIDLSAVTGDRHTVELKVTNQGLIAAQDVRLRFEDGDVWNVTPLADDIGAIPPKSTITVPVTFTRVSAGGGSSRPAAPAAGGGAVGCRPPSLGVDWVLVCGPFGVAYWAPVVVVDPGSCPPPPITSGNPPAWTAYLPQFPFVPGGGSTGPGRRFPIDIGYGPRNFVGYSGTNDCSCVKEGYVEKCSSAEAGFKADASAAVQAALNRVLGPVKWLSIQGFEVKFAGSAKLCTCCEEIDGQGVTGLKLEGDLGGSVEAKLFAGPQFQIPDISVTVPGLAEAKAEVFAGAGIELTATGSVKINGKTECFLENPEVFVDGKVRLGTPIGLKGKGKIAGKDSTGHEVELEGEFFGGLDIGASASVTGYLVGGTGGLQFDGCLDGIVAKGELKATGTINGRFAAVGVGISRELVEKVCINEGGGGVAELAGLTDAQIVGRMLGHESPGAMLRAVTGVESAGDSVGAQSSPRLLSDLLVRHLGIHPVRAGESVGAPVFTQSLASASSVDAARREAAVRRSEARAARPAAGAEGVCAQVKLEIEQQAVVTRKGIGATLEIINESADLPLEDVGVSIQIYDRRGNVVNDRFAILPPELTRLQPMAQPPTNRLALGGLTLTLPANTTGSARWLIVPRDTAAPEEPTEYFVGGHLSYRSGDIVRTAELAPGGVTVYPNARLYLKYFHQRDVFADDPFTDVVEPSQPFVLGVMVENRGRGVAKNFTITSAQPRIVDNAKGLLVNFEIIASEVAGKTLQPSLTASFGDVPAGGIAIGRWLLKSSLQGLFLDYKATLEHEDRFGERGVSVFEGVEIHEMIRQVEVGGAFADGKPDFFVNDVKDPDDLGDTLYLSDGRIEAVSAVLDGALDGAPSPGDLEVELTARAPRGWAYLRVPDPADPTLRLAQVRRPDGSVVPPACVWTTDRTFIGLSKRPLVENRIHFVDLDSPGRYTLVYRRDESVPDTAPPASRVTELSATSPVLIPVRWSGEDDASGTGVDSYDVFVSVDGGAFRRWLAGTRNLSAFYPGAAGRRYAFYTVARDKAGNVEAAPSTPDTSTAAVGNSAPEIEPVADVAVDEGARAEVTLRATDQDLPGDTLSFELVSGPAGASLDAVSGLFRWQTGEADGPSSRVVRVRVTDDGTPAASVEREFRVQVREVNQPVTLRPVAALHEAVEGVLFRLPIGADDPDLPANPLRFSLRPGAPAGTAIHAVSGEFSWVPSESQGGTTHTVEVEVTDQGNPATTARASFRVAVAKTNSPPRLESLADATVWEGDLVERIARGTDGDLPVQTLRFELGAGAASGASVDGVSGRFTWEPAEEHASRSHAFRVLVRDSGEPEMSAERTFTVTVRPLKPGLNLPARAENGDVSFRFKGRAGARHALQGSVNLVDWADLEEFVTAKPVHPLVDRSSSGFPWRYFRVVERP